MDAFPESAQVKSDEIDLSIYRSLDLFAGAEGPAYTRRLEAGPSGPALF
jgi:hypothetical protein